MITHTQCSPSHRYRAGLIQFLSQPRFTHAVTLNPNRGDLHIGTLRTYFKRFCMEVDRQLMGHSRPHLVASARRFVALAMPEKMLANAHLHLAVDLNGAYAAGLSDSEIKRTIWLIWRKITNGSGDAHVEVRRDDGWADYITKEVRTAGHDYFLSTDYHSN